MDAVRTIFVETAVYRYTDSLTEYTSKLSVNFGAEIELYSWNHSENENDM